MLGRWSMFLAGKAFLDYRRPEGAQHPVYPRFYLGAHAAAVCSSCRSSPCAARMTLTLSMSVRRTLLGIELCCGCGARKGGQAQASLMYAHDGRIRIERALQPLRIGDLRHQAAIGQRRGFAVAIAAGVRTAGERALEGL